MLALSNDGIGAILSGKSSLNSIITIPYVPPPLRDSRADPGIITPIILWVLRYSDRPRRCRMKIRRGI
jgi:hypothetical protein